MRPPCPHLAIAFAVFSASFACLSTTTADEVVLREQKAVDQYLVLTTGRVVKGQLAPRPGGYEVTLPAGRMFIGESQVRFTAASMDDAYRRMRASVNELTPDTHLALARWCLTNQMRDKARAEVLDALHLDKYRDDARQMLEAIVRDEKTASISVKKAQPDPEPNLFPERRSLGGLPPELAQTFTKRIQPLLSNKCGNARCHGAGRNAFTMKPSLGRPTAFLTEQNLAQVMQQIDFRDPVRSPLLSQTQGLHGGSRQLLFSHRSGGQQVQLLRRWITDVVRATGQEQAEPVIQTVSASVDVTPIDQSAVETEREISKHSSDADAIYRAQSATRQDAFDPNEFNQRYHGRQRNVRPTGTSRATEISHE